MSQHLQDQRIKTLYVARQASCCAEPVTQEGKKIFPSRLREHSHVCVTARCCYADCWTVYLPDLILLSDFYVDNLKKSDSSCFCHVNRIRIGILTWGIYTKHILPQTFLFFQSPFYCPATQWRMPDVTSLVGITANDPSEKTGKRCQRSRQ